MQHFDLRIFEVFGVAGYQDQILDSADRGQEGIDLRYRSSRPLGSTHGGTPGQVGLQVEGQYAELKLGDQVLVSARLQGWVGARIRTLGQCRTGSRRSRPH